MTNGQKFAVDLTKLVLKAQARADAVVRKIVIDCGVRVVMLSPVGDPSHWQSKPPPGYVGGRFRANWQYGETRIPEGTIDAVDPRGTETIAKLRASVTQQANGKIHFLTNNLPYAMELERGHSRQAPNGMVAITVREFQAVVAKAIK